MLIVNQKNYNKKWNLTPSKAINNIKEIIEGVVREVPKTKTKSQEIDLNNSLIIDKKSMEGTALKILAMTEDSLVMAITHRDYKNLLGVQYHPESILSEYGHKLLGNFLSIS